jgi:hypothetical protein
MIIWECRYVIHHSHVRDHTSFTESNVYAVTALPAIALENRKIITSTYERTPFRSM